MQRQDTNAEMIKLQATFKIRASRSCHFFIATVDSHGSLGYLGLDIAESTRPSEHLIATLPLNLKVFIPHRTQKIESTTGPIYPALYLQL